MFNQTFSNALTSASIFAEQPSHVTTPLRIHQLAALHAMKEKETLLRTGYSIPNMSDTLFSQYAFLGDRVGVGKTFMVLGHISQMSLEPLRPQNPLSNLHPQSTSSCFSIHPLATSDNLYDSLIVVPHTIYRQWQDTIKTHTNFKVIYLKNLRDLDKDSLVTNLQTSHITLISNTLLPMFMNSLRAREVVNPMWRRVFYDEADTIKIPSTCMSPSAIMTWYVTASFTNMLFTNQYYHSYLLRQLSTTFLDSLHPILRERVQTHIDAHPSITFYKMQSNGFFTERIKSSHPLRAHLVVLNDNDFLDTSINLPPLINTVIRCQANSGQQLVQSIIPPDTEDMLNAGDVKGALQSLGISVHTNITIVEAVTSFRQKEVDRLQRLLAFKREETYATPQAKEAALKTLEEKIQKLSEQIQIIRSRIDTTLAANETCSICYDSASDPVLTPCCSKIFCAPCILTWMKRIASCPLCRNAFQPNELCGIGEQTLVEMKEKPPKKMEALLTLLQENPDGRFLIFSRYENPLAAIQEIIPSARSVLGNKDVIANTLSEFEEGTTKVLLLNSRNTAAGLNIPSATHVILLHKMVDEEEKQILGRAYRMGRTKPLHFIKLLHERE